MKKDFDYYIFIDYSKSVIGYSIINKSNLNAIKSKLKKFKHYKEAQNRKLYLKNIKTTLNRENILDYFNKIKIKEMRENIEIFVDVFDFIKEHKHCIVFISVDDRQFKNFKRFVSIEGFKGIKVVRESQLIKGSIEYKTSLILDNLLNIERLKE